MVRLLSIYGAPLTSVNNFVFLDIKAIVFCWEFVGDPAALQLVVLDKVSEVMYEVKFDREICAFVVDKVSHVVPYCSLDC